MTWHTDGTAILNPWWNPHLERLRRSLSGSRINSLQRDRTNCPMHHFFQRHQDISFDLVCRLLLEKKNLFYSIKENSILACIVHFSFFRATTRLISLLQYSMVT